MGCKLRMTTCSEIDLSAAESRLQAQGLQPVEYREEKDLLPDKEYMKRPLNGLEGGITRDKHWALIWCTTTQ